MKQGKIETKKNVVDYFFLLILNATTLVWTFIISYKEQYKYTSNFLHIILPRVSPLLFQCSF